MTSWRTRGLIRLACLLVSVGAATTAIPSSAADAAGLSWARSVAVQPPANAGADPDIVVTSLACPSAGSCTAIGSYQDTSGETQGLLATDTGGSWITASEAQLPFNALSTNPDVTLTSVACASSGNCTAVGSYLDSNGLRQGLLLTETSASWGQGREVIHPQGVASVATNPNIDLTSVACATATNCLVAGTYADSKGYPEGLLETEINGAWSETEKNGHYSYTGAEASLPGDSAAEPNVALASVSCGAVGHCVIVGSYLNSSSEQEALLLTGTVSSGAWTFTESAASLPSGAATSPGASLSSVSCAASGACSAVGSYENASHREQGLLVAETGSVWETGTTAALPGDAASDPGVSLSSVSCTSAGDCDAVGDYYTGNGNLQGLMLTATAGNWGSADEPTLPSDAGSAEFVSLSSVSCSAASTCAATGNYADESFSLHPLVLSQSSNGSWSTGTEPALPYPNASPDASVEALACAPDAGCAEIADYTDQSNNQLAGATNGTTTPAATPTLSLSAPPAVTETGTVLAANAVTATLSGGASDTGSVTFSVFGPQDSPPSSCAYGGTTISTAAVSGDGSYTPAQSFTPSSAGDYWWYASYGGDLGNAPAAATCGASMGRTVVQSPTITLNAPATSTLNATISHTEIAASLSGVAVNAGGSLTFTVFGPESVAPTNCSVGGIQIGSDSVHGTGSLSPASGFTPASVGDYWWYASYTGDSSDPAAASNCGAQMAETVVRATTALSLDPASTNTTTGSSPATPISASLLGGVDPTGTVTFSVFGPQASPPVSCTAEGSTVGAASVKDDGTYASASNFIPSATGDYWWYATYSGDAANEPSGSGCGSLMPETVVSAPAAKPTVPEPSTTTTAKPPAVATTRIAGITTGANVLKVTLTCHASSRQSCAGAITATATEISSFKTTARDKVVRRTRKRVVTIATLSFKLRGGNSRQVSIKLNRVGTNLLASRRKLAAVLKLREGRTILSRDVTLRFTAPAKRRRKA
jgi:hypothetical protein